MKMFVRMYKYALDEISLKVIGHVDEFHHLSGREYLMICKKIDEDDRILDR